MNRAEEEEKIGAYQWTQFEIVEITENAVPHHQSIQAETTQTSSTSLFLGSCEEQQSAMATAKVDNPVDDYEAKRKDGFTDVL